MKTVSVSVTARDISRAKKLIATPGKRRTRFCPVSLALKRACRTQDVSSGATEFHVRGACFVSPLSVSEFIHRFDAGRTVEPFSFTLPNPK